MSQRLGTQAGYGLSASLGILGGESPRLPLLLVLIPIPQPFSWGAERCDLGRPREKGGGVRHGESVVVFQEVKGREGREVNLEIWRPLAGLYR